MFSTAFLALVLAASSPSSPPPKSNLVIQPCEAGDHQQFETIECDIPLRNTGDRPITISHAEGAAKNDTIDPGVVVPPHGSAYLRTRIALADALGFTQHSFRFQTDEPGALARRGSTVYVFVSTVLDQGNPSLDFGVLKTEDLPRAKSLSVSSREVEDFRITGVASKPDYMTVTITDEGRGVKVEVGRNAPIGLLHEKVRLNVTGPKQPMIAVAVAAKIESDIVPDSNPLSLGLMRTNAKNSFMIRLSSRSGKDFRVGKLSLNRVKAKTSVGPCTPATTGCKIVHLDIANDQTQGHLGDILSIELPDTGQVLPIRIEGMLLAPEVPIHNINKELEEKKKPTGQASSAPVASEKLDLTQTIKQTVAEANEVPPPGNGPLLRWSVANQEDVYAFIVWRSDSEEGPMHRVNDELIKVVEGGSGNYQWRDNSAVSGKTYWYQIGYVKPDGSKADLSGRQRVVAK